MKNIKIILGFILISLITYSCSDEYLEEAPPHILIADNLFQDLEGFETGLNGLYSLVRNEHSGGAFSLTNTHNFPFTDLAMLGTDNSYSNWYHQNILIYNNWGEFNNSLNPIFRNTFTWLYQIVNTANTIITRAEAADMEWSEADKKRVIAEARLIRAWAYRHLTFLWGDVPLVLQETVGSRIKTDWERAPVSEIRNEMEKDWLYAKENLPVTSSNPGKVVKGVAQHYLAELYLTQGKNQQAKEEAEELINNGPYSLINERYGVNENAPGVPFMDQFIDGNINKSEGNTEALWVFQHERLVTGGGGSILRRWWVNQYHALRVDGKTPINVTVENGGRGLGRAAATKFAMELYEDGDHRGSEHAWRKFWIINFPSNIPAGYELGDTIYINLTQTESLNNPNWPNTRKWDWVHPDELGSSQQFNDIVYLRLAETYLILAEAQMKLDQLDAAAETINVLRRRANASEISAEDVDIDFILDERSRELFSEEHRRYTLLRTNKWLERVRKYNPIAGPVVTEKDLLFPIPQDVIDANIGKEMPQNPGY